MCDFAERLTAAFNQGKTIVGEYDPAHHPAPRSNCHDNAADYVRRNGGTIIHGWVPQGAGYYAKHSIVQHNDRMIEVTTQNQTPRPFVRHDMFSDDWNTLGIFVTDFEAWSKGEHMRATPDKPGMFGLLRRLKG
jgi:hypothetical protein